MTATGPIRVLVAEDHFLARFALVGFLQDQIGVQVVAKAEGGIEAVNLYREHKPDVLLLDLDLPELDGFSVIDAIKRDNPAALILVLSNLDGEEDIHRAVQAGVRGFLRKDVSGDMLLEAIRRVHAGQRYFSPEVAAKIAQRSSQSDLTPRELQILERLVLGMSNRHIAEALSLRESTVRIYVSNVLVKLNVKSRTEAVILALKRGIVRTL